MTYKFSYKFYNIPWSIKSYLRFWDTKGPKFTFIIKYFIFIDTIEIQTNSFWNEWNKILNYIFIILKVESLL